MVKLKDLSHMAEVGQLIKHGNYLSLGSVNNVAHKYRVR